MSAAPAQAPAALPQMQALQSSNVESIGYAPEDRVLYIRFKTGGLYSYADVPAGVYQGFLTAESPGNYFRAAISGKFVHTKVQ